MHTGLHGVGKGEAHPTRAAASFKAKGPLAAWLDSLSPRLKFAIIVGCVMVFFGLHNILQVTRKIPCFTPLMTLLLFLY